MSRVESNLWVHFLFYVKVNGSIYGVVGRGVGYGVDIGIGDELYSGVW